MNARFKIYRKTKFTEPESFYVKKINEALRLINRDNVEFATLHHPRMQLDMIMKGGPILQLWGWYISRCRKHKHEACDTTCYAERGPMWNWIFIKEHE